MVIEVNGQPYEIDIDEDVPLLWLLRDHLGLTGTKFSCGLGVCGACMVHLNGAAVQSCTLPASAAEGGRITTIEGLGAGALHPVQRAWIAEQVPQCGFCQPGMIMAAAALLERVPRPTDAGIDAVMTNLCRCGTYPRIRRAIHRAAREAAGKHTGSRSDGEDSES